MSSTSSVPFSFKLLTRERRNHRGRVRDAHALPHGHQLALPHRATQPAGRRCNFQKHRRRRLAAASSPPRSTACSAPTFVIFSGGLGPTEDDLTREAVAEALGLTLQRDPEILTRLEQRFAERGWKMSPNNAKQADVLDGATALPNPNGTAPGQWLSGEFDGREHIIVLLPGPPHELKALFETEVRERLHAKVPPAFLAIRTLEDRHARRIRGRRARRAHLQALHRRRDHHPRRRRRNRTALQDSRAATQDAAQRRVDEVAGVVEDELDDAVYSRNGESLEQIVGYWLQMRNATVAVAESCTGGLLAERITSISGSSRYFLGGAVVYSNALKTELAGVPAEMIDRHGAVSREVAAALAEGIRYRCESTLGVGITGVAGPNGGTPDKPVGLVFHAVASSTGTEVVQRNFPGDRKRIRRFASTMALDMVRKKLM